MATLSLDELSVTSFATEPDPAGTDTAVQETNEDPNCWSPLCGPTFWETCETQLG